MAYCVRCGVKLEEGSTACPLCHTEVIAPADVIGVQRESLFPSETEGEAERISHQRLDKNRKGVIELVIAFMAIAVVTLLITAFALDGTFVPWISIASVIIGGAYILVLFFVRPTFPKIASWYIGLTMLLLVAIDAHDLILTWSVPSVMSLLLLWIVGVLPWVLPKHLRLRGVIGAIVAIAGYLVALDIMLSGQIVWSLAIALPTYAVVLGSLLLFYLRLHFGKPTVTDSVLSVILTACWGVVAGDFFHLRSLRSTQMLSWSTSVLVVALCLLIFLTLNVTLRRVRNYFNNRLN